MAPLFLDTNIIIRYLTRDNPAQAEKAHNILQRLELGTLSATTCEGVIVEVVQVLSSKVLYHLPRQVIRERLSPVVMLPGIKLGRKTTYLRALEVYASTTLDFVDALIVAHMERAKIGTILSFDHDFDGIPGITRVDYAPQ